MEVRDRLPFACPGAPWEYPIDRRVSWGGCTGGCSEPERPVYTGGLVTSPDRVVFSIVDEKVWYCESYGGQGPLLLTVRTTDLIRMARGYSEDSRFGFKIGRLGSHSRIGIWLIWLDFDPRPRFASCRIKSSSRSIISEDIGEDVHVVVGS
jgi:hypothetical protein